MVYPAATVADCAVGSYPAFSTLPAGQARRRYVFCGTFTWISPARRYLVSRSLEARTFLTFGFSFPGCSYPAAIVVECIRITFFLQEVYQLFAFFRVALKKRPLSRSSKLIVKKNTFLSPFICRKEPQAQQGFEPGQKKYFRTKMEQLTKS